MTHIDASMDNPRLFHPVPMKFEQTVGANPSCSVVMTSYRDTRYLREAVDSVLAQDFTDFELIVVDDGSPDPKPVAALLELDPRIRVMRLDDNRGTAVAANAGIATARAPIIARLDSDDVAEPDWLAAVVGALHADPKLGLVGSAVTLIDPQGFVTGHQAMPESDFGIRFTLLFHCPFYHSTTAYRRSLFDQAGGYRPDQPVSQDHYLWAAMLPHCRARNLPDRLVRYRLNPDGLSSTNSGDAVGRTLPIREAAWAELGLDFPLANRRLAEDCSAILRDRPEQPGSDRMAARATIETAMARVETLIPELVRANEKADSLQFLHALRSSLQRAARSPASAFEKLSFAVRQHGLKGVYAVFSRRLKSRFGKVRPYREPADGNPVLAALHPVSPYAGFDPSPFPLDLQGWGSGDPAFRVLIAELRPKLIVEVGSWKGASAIHMASLCQQFGLDTRIICIDTWLGSNEHLIGPRPEWRKALQERHGFPQLYYTFLANVLRTGHSDRIVPLANTSDHAAIVLSKLGMRPNLIYIDAAHQEEAVFRDLSHYWPLLAPGGVLLGDDFVHFPGVRAAATRFAADNQLALEDWGEKFVLRAPATTKG